MSSDRDGEMSSDRNRDRNSDKDMRSGKDWAEV